jgi:hypothetical protein
MHVIGNTAVISVVDLQGSMNTRNSELGSSNETPVTSTLDGNEVAGKETETVSDVSEITNQETTIPEINTESSVSCEPEVSVMHISYTLYPELPPPVSLCPCEPKILRGINFEQFFKNTFFCDTMHVLYRLQWNGSSIRY